MIAQTGPEEHNEVEEAQCHQHARGEGKQQVRETKTHLFTIVHAGSTADECHAPPVLEGRDGLLTCGALAA